jgi:hypothetical protein
VNNKYVGNDIGRAKLPIPINHQTIGQRHKISIGEKEIGYAFWSNGEWYFNPRRGLILKEDELIAVLDLIDDISGRASARLAVGMKLRGQS